VRPLLLTAEITSRARATFTDELGYTIIDRCGAARADAIRDGAEAGAIGWLLEADPCGEEEIEALPSLQWIACARGGPVNVDVAAATRHASPCSTHPDAMPPPSPTSSWVRSCASCGTSHGPTC